IPHKNIPHLLIRCVKSIPKRQDLEIIIVDDNSDEKFLDILSSLCSSENVKIIWNEESKGAGAARNLGMSLAKGKWLLFADADDFYVSDFISVLDKYIDIDSDAVFFKV